MPEVRLEIDCADDVQLTGTLFTPESKVVTGSVLICSALGVPRKFYAKFAAWLAGQGFAVLTFDYRGTGDSLPATGIGAICLEDWGRLDMDAAIHALAGRYPDAPVFQIGHSCGGQLIGLADSAAKLSGAILVAATAPNAGRYPAPDRYKMFAVWHLMVPLVGFGRSVFPARKLGISTIDVPAGVMAQWARWARSEDYLFSPRHGVDVSGYAALDFPMLSLGFDDDGYASREAISALLRHYSAAEIEDRHVAVAPLQVGKLEHFGFFKEKVRDSLWVQARDWLAGITAGKPA